MVGLPMGGNKKMWKEVYCTVRPVQSHSYRESVAPKHYVGCAIQSVIHINAKVALAAGWQLTTLT